MAPKWRNFRPNQLGPGTWLRFDANTGDQQPYQRLHNVVEEQPRPQFSDFQEELRNKVDANPGITGEGIPDHFQPDHVNGFGAYIPTPRRRDIQHTIDQFFPRRSNQVGPRQRLGVSRSHRRIPPPPTGISRSLRDVINRRRLPTLAGDDPVPVIGTESIEGAKKSFDVQE